MMIQIESRALADSATVHCVAIIGCLHAFLGLLFMMIAFTKVDSPQITDAFFHEMLITKC